LGQADQYQTRADDVAIGLASSFCLGGDGSPDKGIDPGQAVYSIREPAESHHRRKPMASAIDGADPADTGRAVFFFALRRRAWISFLERILQRPGRSTLGRSGDKRPPAERAYKSGGAT